MRGPGDETGNEETLTSVRHAPVAAAVPSAPGPAATIELSPSGSVEEGTEIALTMSFANLESDSDTSTTDHIFRADMVNADACEGGGMGIDRYMYKVDEDPEVRTGTISAACPPGDYTVEVSISSSGNVKLASATADFTVNAPGQQQQPEPPSTDATLSGLTLSDVTLAFASATTGYTASVANGVDETTVTPTTNDGGATYAIKLGGVTDDDGVIPLSVGSNVITIEVTAEDGNATQTYTVTVTRAAPPSTDATLSGLALSGAALASAFDPAATAYAASVANDVAETTVTPTVNDDGATYVIKLDGVADADGTVFLSVGENVISVVVTAEDGKTVKTYTVTVTRAAPPAPGPSVTIALSPSGAVEPGTAITVTMSFANLEFDSERATRDYVFRADVLDSDNGDADECEDRKNGYGLGVERYMWKVDQDPEVRRGATAAGCAAGDYTVRASIASPDNVELASASAGFSVVEPEPTLSGDATLSGLALSGVTLAFDPATTGYAAEVGNDVTETTVTPVVNDDGATYVVQLDGQVDADGVIPLSVGTNAISIVVTAEDGETTKTYTVAVTRAAPPLSTDATLRSLTLSGLTLAFDPATTRYTAQVGNDVTETTVTAATSDANATYVVQLDGVADADGTIPLSVGENVVAIVVTAEDGEATRTYTVTVTRAAPPLSNDATLSELTLSGVTLAFDPATTGYTASVANSVSETTVTATTNHDGASYAIKLDGVTDADGVIPLSVGTNAISIVVTAEDGETVRTYTVTVTRAAPQLSSDATLRSLTLSGVTLAFDPPTTGYAASVANDVTETTVTPAVNHDGATYAVQLDGQVDADGTVPLSVGENVVAIVVTAEDGETVRTYTVTVTRAAPPLSTDATLRSLTLSGVTLAFDPPNTSYAASVANDVTETTVTPAVNHDGATYAVQLDGQVDADGTVPLSVGENVVAIVVTAEDGETVRTYTVTVTRAAPPLSTDATLRSLTLSGVTLAFDPATTSYAASVANDVERTTVTAATSDANATYVIKLDGVTDTDGTVDLAVGANTISIVVTAEDGETARTYTVTVTRAEPPSDDATLSGLELSGVTLAFDPATDSYDASVAHDVEQTTVTATPNQDGAAYAVQLDGVADADGTVDLAVGESVISIVVTAEDGETARTYSVTVTRAPAAPEPTPEQTKPFIEVHFPGGPALTQGEETGVEIRFHNLELGRNVKHRFWADIVDNSGNAASACEGRGFGQTRNMSHVDENPEVRTAIISAACPAGEYEIKVFIIDSNGGGIARTAVEFRVD